MLCDSVQEVLYAYREQRRDELPDGVLLAPGVYYSLLRSRLWNRARSTPEFDPRPPDLFGVPLFPAERLDPGTWRVLDYTGEGQVR